MVVLTTSPAGLGHMRVTEALHGGLDQDVRAEVLGLRDPSIQIMHRMTSRNRILRAGMELVQNNPIFEEKFTRRYRHYLRKQGEEALERLVDLASRRRPKPSTLVIVSTHFGLAHQIASIKDKLSEKLCCCVILVVVVTDDSPQKIWAVGGADYIFVPSSSTKDELSEYLQSFTKVIPEILVIPYPVSLQLAKGLEEAELKERQEQLAAKCKVKMQVIVPISGAAVQLKYFRELILVLGYGGRVDVTVVSRDSSQTADFLAWCQKQTSVRVVADEFDRDVVLDYEKEIEKNIFAVEITKPSEQAFKALITPKQKGGVLLLFSAPVGRQEYDNLNFLRRHALIPSFEDQAALDDSEKLEEIDAEILKRARSWRGILLKRRGDSAGENILKFREKGILKAMCDFSGFMDHPELSGDGVESFWENLYLRVREKCEKR